MEKHACDDDLLLLNQFDLKELIEEYSVTNVDELLYLVKKLAN